MRPTAHGSGAPDLGGPFRIAAPGSPTGCQNAASELGQSQKVTSAWRPCGRNAEYARSVMRVRFDIVARRWTSSVRVPSRLSDVHRATRGAVRCRARDLEFQNRFHRATLARGLAYNRLLLDHLVIRPQSDRGYSVIERA